MNLLRAVYRPVIRRATRKAFVGKNRSQNRPEDGRFTRGQVDELVREAWRKVVQMATDPPKQPTFGSRMNVMLACLSYSMLQVLLAAGIERMYSIELISDAAWEVYRKWAILPRLFARLLTQKPEENMRICVNSFLRFPFNPPGYVVQRASSDRGIAFNVLACPIARYLGELGAADLCAASWCNLDFALAEMWGGKLERTGTLAEGRDRCDFQFKTAPACSHGVQRG